VCHIRILTTLQIGYTHILNTTGVFVKKVRASGGLASKLDVNSTQDSY
jgi:hypothetical protein